MARPPGHKIELAAEERVVLERRARAEKLPFHVQLNAREAAQRQPVADRQLARDRFDRGDLLRGETARATRARLIFQSWDVQRARIVLYGAEGLAYTEIAARLDTSAGLAGRWRRRFAEQGLDRLVIELAVTDASASTIWRWLHEDAIKPWQQQCWIYQRDPESPSRPGERLICTPACSRASACVRTST